MALVFSIELLGSNSLRLTSPSSSFILAMIELASSSTLAESLHDSAARQRLVKIKGGNPTIEYSAGFKAVR